MAIDPNNSRQNAIKQWIEDIVIAQNFCPFAAKPYEEGSIDIQVFDSKNEFPFTPILGYLKQFVEEQRVDTALLVFPETLANFEVFNAFFQELDDIVFSQYEESVVMAGFHPNYTFAAYDTNDIVHWIQRSPYPVVHLIQGHLIDEVKNRMPDTSAITERNLLQAQKLGIQFFKEHLSLDSPH